MKKIFLLITLVILTTCLNQKVIAACVLTKAAGVTSFNIGDIVLTDQPSVGSVIKSFKVTPGEAGESAGCVVGRSLYLKGSPTGMKYLGLTDVYQSNVPGVGYAICYDSCNGQTTAWPMFITDDYHIGCACSMAHPWILVLIATGPVSNGILETGVYAEAQVEIGPIQDISITGGSIKAVDCTLDKSNISVPLGDISAEKFLNPGDVAGSSYFDIGLTCDGKANISISLDGEKNEDSPDGSVLKLTDSPDTASGIGAQILYNDVPLLIGQSLDLKITDGNVKETFSFAARYYQTQKIVKPGSANAAATLNITYQ